MLGLAIRFLENALGESNTALPLLALATILFAAGIFLEYRTIKKTGYTHNMTTTSFMESTGMPLFATLAATAIGLASVNVADGPGLVDILRGVGMQTARMSLEAKLITSSLISIGINQAILNGKTEPLVKVVNAVVEKFPMGPQFHEHLSQHMRMDMFPDYDQTTRYKRQASELLRQ